MDVAEFSNPTIQGRGNSLKVVHGADDNLIVSFSLEPVLQGAASEAAGRRIYKDTPFISIRFPGDRTREIKRKVDMRGNDNAAPDPERWPRQWQAFQRQHADVHDGTPLEHWGPMAKGEAMTYKSYNCHTVENLAACSDAVLASMPHGARKLRDMAIAWLKTTGDNAESMRLAAENQQLKDDIEMLKGQVAELAARRKPGRPKAAESEEEGA